jgi:predicted porin
MRENDAQVLTPRSNLWYLGLTQVFTYAFKLDAQVARIDFRSGDNDANLFMLRTTYSLSKRTSVYAEASHVRNSGMATYSASGGQAGGNPAPGGNQTAVALGVSHTF